MSTREKRASRRRQRVREDILNVTRELVLSGGFASLTLTAIARELELTKPALYYYFDSKETLLFALLHESMVAEVEAVEAAVATAANGAEGVEALMRAVANHYEERFDEFRLVYLMGQVGHAMQLDSDKLQHIRPLNDRLYSRAAELVAADREAGLIAADIDARRTVFVAHCAVLGIFTLEGLVESAGDYPLIHSHADMIDDLVRAHTARLRAPR